MTTLKTRAEATVDRPADEIWARVGDFSDVSWIPGSEQVRVTMEGALRTVWRDAIGINVIQRLTEHDDERHTYSYVLAEPINFEKMMGPGKIAHTISGTLTITPTGQSRSHVTWDLEVDDFLFAGTSREYQAALDSLK